METKQAYKTTEFWATALILAVNGLNVLGLWDFTSNQQSTKWGAVVAAAYAIARGLAKQGVKPTE